MLDTGAIYRKLIRRSVGIVGTGVMALACVYCYLFYNMSGSNRNGAREGSDQIILLGAGLWGRGCDEVDDGETEGE